MREFSHPTGAKLYISWKAADHLRAHPDVTDRLVSEAFTQIQLQPGQKKIECEIDFGRQIGFTSKVEAQRISPSEQTSFTYRIGRGRRYPSRVIAGIQKPPTQFLTIVAGIDGRKSQARSIDVFELETAYTGTIAPLEPLSSKSLHKDKTKSLNENISSALRNNNTRFWCENALIHEPSISATDLFVCSWEILITRRLELGPDAFPEGGPYWTPSVNSP